MAYLADAEVAEFTELKTLLDVTQGNLSVHLRKLEEAGYVSIDKSFIDRKPLTRARITDAGRKAFASSHQPLLPSTENCAAPSCGAAVKRAYRAIRWRVNRSPTCPRLQAPDTWYAREGSLCVA
ncbi:MAG: transcriptional regulator [Hyphomonadaceae bacterium]|nr:transcriptional regulator [Hyphomonadaceae bacterium]